MFRRIVKFINIILVLVLAFLGLYALFLSAYILEYVAVIIFYLPIVVVILRVPLIATFVNALLVAIILLCLVFSIKTMIRKVEDTEFYLGESIAIVFVLSFLVSIVFPPKPVNTNIYVVPSIVVWAPVYEEFFFRIILLMLPLSVMSRDYWVIFRGRATIGSIDRILLAISSVIFGLYHFSRGVGMVIVATIAGLFMGYLCLRYGIATSIATHFLLNSMVGSQVVARVYRHVLVFYICSVAGLMLVTAGILTIVFAVLYHVR